MRDQRRTDAANHVIGQETLRPQFVFQRTSEHPQREHIEEDMLEIGMHEMHLGGEDFAVYLQHIPGAFVSIGSASEYGLHHPAFNPDERLIAPAAHYFARLAEEALQHI